MWALEIEPESSARATSAFNCSPAPKSRLLGKYIVDIWAHQDSDAYSWLTSIIRRHYSTDPMSIENC